MKAGKKQYLLDSSVIIDLYTADKEFLLKLPSFGDMIIPDIILSEVNIPDSDCFIDNGFSIHEITIEILRQRCGHTR